MFSETFTHFLTKIFKDQQVYDVKIISVNIFDDHILKGGHVEETKQQPYHSFRKGNALSFSTVITAEYTKEDEINSIANESFRKMLIHVCDKFQGHLMKFINDLGDPFFTDIESIVLGEFERYDTMEGGLTSSTSQQNDTQNNSKVLGMTEGTLNVVSIIAILVCGIVTSALLIASVKFYRKEKQLKAFSWRAKEIASINAATLSSNNSHGTLGQVNHPVRVFDDYSFNPLRSNNVYTSEVPPYNGYRHGLIHNHPNEEEIAFSSVWPESAPPTLFPVSGETATRTPPPPPNLSYSNELEKLPKKHVFAPPGKIGVAIDVYNGQPTVHKLRKGSPLENMLQPNDIIMAIDDEDTSCLSAADVTSMMVKRMDRVRKITFVRRGS